VRILHVGWGFSPWRPGGLILYAEDLMAAQVARGHEVSYFMSGRQYPRLSGPRLKRWRRGEVAMYEVVNPPIVAGMEHGTRNPERDLSEPRMEAVFERVLAEIRPDVLHFQELHGLPSSLIDVAGAAGVPTLMTLQDYFPLCATLRLFDADRRVCMRRDVGADCVARNADAPGDPRALIRDTLLHDIAWARRKLRLPELGRGQLEERVIRRYRPPEAPGRGNPALAPAFQRRRDVNVERLGRVDRLIAQSPRVAEIYRDLGVPGARMTTLPFTLGHIERLEPRTMPSAPSPITFGTLNGCASVTKGAEVVRDALRALRAAGAEGSFRLRVYGYVLPDVMDELTAFEGVEVRGLYGREELSGLLDGVDVGVIPSVWEEALGYTGLEMVAKGVPMIANPLGGVVEYAREGETAWLNRSATGQGLAELMLDLIRHPERVVGMHERLLRARGGILSSWAQHVDAIEDLCHELAGVAI
jgi:glycosyltransferase involved in cell wall biosynthesis